MSRTGPDPVLLNTTSDSSKEKEKQGFFKAIKKKKKKVRRCFYSSEIIKSRSRFGIKLTCDITGF